jgi:hypothetical protein
MVWIYLNNSIGNYEELLCTWAASGQPNRGWAASPRATQGRRPPWRGVAAPTKFPVSRRLGRWGNRSRRRSARGGARFRGWSGENLTVSGSLRQRCSSGGESLAAGRRRGRGWRWSGRRGSRDSGGACGRAGRAGGWLEKAGVTPHVSKPHDYVNHMFMRP